MTRSPNRLITCPAHSARERRVEGEPDVRVAPDPIRDPDPRAARDDAARRPRRLDRAGTGRDAPRRERRAVAMPDAAGSEDERPLRGLRALREARAASPSAGRARPRPVALPRRPLSAAPASRRERPRRVAGLGLGLASGERTDRREQEEREARGQEHVADRGDVLDERDGDRDDVAEGPGVEQEVGVERRLQHDVVERRADRRGSKPGGHDARPQTGM